jgi:N-acyl-D-amino-acid deacylase
VAQTIGHTQVRRVVLGEADRRPSNDELNQMTDLVEEAMKAGAIGVSTALIYPPAVFASSEEIAALVKVAGQHGGGYYTHMRNEGDQLEQAIDEAVEIGRVGKASVHIFHLKAAGRQNWSKMQLAIDKIKAARAAGEHVTADIYPYTHNGLAFTAFIHPRHFSQGLQYFFGRADTPALRAEIRKEMETTTGWENWYRNVGYDWNKVVIGSTGESQYAPLVGQAVAQIAKASNEDPWDTFFNLVKRGTTFALPESMSEENLRLAIREGFACFCTDVGPIRLNQLSGHPRSFGSFPRLLSRYVREEKVISLEQFVAQASAAAARAIMAHDRGRLAEGLAADIIVFDYNEVADRATFTSPAQLSVGMKHVIVNGGLVLDNSQFTGHRPGRVLRGPGHRP